MSEGEVSNWTLGLKLSSQDRFQSKFQTNLIQFQPQMHCHSACPGQPREHFNYQRSSGMLHKKLLIAGSGCPRLLRSALFKSGGFLIWRLLDIQLFRLSP